MAAVCIASPVPPTPSHALLISSPTGGNALASRPVRSAAVAAAAVLVVVLVLLAAVLLVGLVLSGALQHSESTIGSGGRPSSAPSAQFSQYSVTGATETELYLLQRDNAYYSGLSGSTAMQVMTAFGQDAGCGALNNCALGSYNTSSAVFIAQSGARMAALLAVFHGFSQWLPTTVTYLQTGLLRRMQQFELWLLTADGIEAGGADGDVNQRTARGMIAFDCYVLAQAGGYFSGLPGAGLPGSVQAMFEDFTWRHVEVAANTTSWETVGYNKNVARCLHPAFAMALYGQTAFTRLFPRSAAGFWQCWDEVTRGAYEPDNSPTYMVWNLYQWYMMAAALGRLTRHAANASDPHGYMSDNPDWTRIVDGLVDATMPHGGGSNFNFAVTANNPGNWTWNIGGSYAPFVLKMAFAVSGNATYLYQARRVARFQVLTGQLEASQLDATEMWPPYVQAYNTLGLQPSSSRVSTVSYMRMSASCSGWSSAYGCIYSSQPSMTALLPARIALRATSSSSNNDNNPYILMSVSGLGFHANMDQWMGLDTTFYQFASTAARLSNPTQVNQCNCQLLVPQKLLTTLNPTTGSAYTFPLRPVDLGSQSFYSLVQQTSAGGYYGYQVLNASATQLSTGSGYGEVTFLQYEQAGYRSIRQVLLSKAGVVVVVDSVWSDGSSPTSEAMAGGVIWRLWPEVAASGVNWAVQSWQMKINNTNTVPHSAQSALFLVSKAPGRSIGLLSEPVLDEWQAAVDNSAMYSQTLNTLYAHDDLSDGGLHTFVTVIVPLNASNCAGSGLRALVQGIDIVHSAARSTSVFIPGQGTLVVPASHTVPQPGAAGVAVPFVWYSAFNVSAGAVSVWHDLSGHGYHAQQSNATFRPTASATALRGCPAVSFSRSWLDAGLVFPTHHDYSMVGLVLLGDVTSPAINWLIGSPWSSGHGLGFENGRLCVMHNWYGVACANTAVPSNTVVQFSAVFTTSTQNVQLFYNGTLVGQQALTSNNPPWDQALTLGFHDFSYFFQGTLSELIVFDSALSSTKRANFERQLMARYAKCLP